MLRVGLDPSRHPLDVRVLEPAGATVTELAEAPGSDHAEPTEPEPVAPAHLHGARRLFDPDDLNGDVERTATGTPRWRYDLARADRAISVSVPTSSDNGGSACGGTYGGAVLGGRM